MFGIATNPQATLTKSYFMMAFKGNDVDNPSLI